MTTRGITPRRYDCGSHGLLTAKQISAVSGRALNSVYVRIKSGYTGERLVAHRIVVERSVGRRCFRAECTPTLGNSAIFLACKLARKFTSRPPTVSELREQFGMSRATAYRWRAAFIDAMGMAA